MARSTILIAVVLIFAISGSFGSIPHGRRLISRDQLQNLVQLARSKYTNVLIQNPILQGNYPHTGQPNSQFWDDVTDLWGWTAGFYPGVLWQLYRLTNDGFWADESVIATEKLRPRENDTGTQDVGFVIMSSSFTIIILHT